MSSILEACGKIFFYSHEYFFESSETDASEFESVSHAKGALLGDANGEVLHSGVWFPAHIKKDAKRGTYEAVVENFPTQAGGSETIELFALHEDSVRFSSEPPSLQ